MLLIWATIIHTFSSLIHPAGEFSFEEMRMWGQPKISSCCLCVWCKSKELGGKEGGDRGEGGKIPNINGGNLLCRFSVTYRKFLDKVAFRILSNINDGSSLRKYVSIFR